MDQLQVKEITLKKHYRFMFENFVISSQRELFLLLEENDGVIDSLKFNFSIYKYGYPNDEVGHPLMKFGLGFYGFYEVFNSPWIEDIKINNRSHPSHSDDAFKRKRHFIAKFKDVTLEVIADKYEEVQITKDEFINIVKKEIEYIKEI